MFLAGLGLGLLLASAFSAFFWWWWAFGATLLTIATFAALIVAKRDR